MAVEPEAEPAGFGGELSEGLEHAKGMGEFEGTDRAGCQGFTGTGAMSLLAQSPPVLQQAADGFSKGRQRTCSIPAPGRRLFWLLAVCGRWSGLSGLAGAPGCR